MQPGNLFANASPPLEAERFETLLQHRNLVVERIVSSSKITATQYVQSQDEWVVLLQGRSTLTVAGSKVELQAGDYLFLAAGTAHTVEQVSHGALWLAVHLHPRCADRQERDDPAAP
jgi:cupin 2 domain-containing protein